MPERFKPHLDKLFWIILIPTSVFMIGWTAVACFEPLMLLIMLPTDALVMYFLITPLFGYVELRESTMFIKFGLVLKKEIPYSKIYKITTARKLYSDSVTSLKNSLEHVNVWYNSFDVVSLSVKSNDELIRKLEEKIKIQTETKSK